jgi:hypothetical protein
MKKTLLITASVIVVLLLALIILPIAFKGKIEEIVKKEASGMLEADVNFSGVDLSFIRNFPNASISVNDFSVVGRNEFVGDTLTRIKQTAVVVNLMSIFGDSGYDVKRIDIVEPYIHAKVLADGKANWDIMPVDTTAVDTTATEPSAFKLKLQELNLEDAHIIYDDLAGNMHAEIEHFDATLSGDMTESLTTLKLDAETEALTFIMDKIPYLNSARFATDITLAADLNAMKFTISESKFFLNDITMGLDGWLAMLDEGFDMDLKLNTPQIGFKSILSLVPAIYTKDFEDIKADGKVSLDGFAKGKYTETSMPAFDVKLLVENAWFQYPDLPSKVENININFQAKNPDGNLENTVINVNPFSFAVGGNPFALTANIAGMADPAFAFTAKGKFDLGSVKNFYPLEEGMSLSGLFTADMNAAGKMSYVEKEQYEQLQFGGTLALANMILKTASLKDEVSIKNAAMTFNPQTVTLSNLAVQIGKNDIAASGSLQNFIGYVLLDKTIRGNLALTSNYLNVSDFMPTDSLAAGSEVPAETETAAPADSTATEMIAIPQNIDFTMSADFKKIIYDNIELDNSKGQLIARNGILSLRNLMTNAFDGSMKINGDYNTQNPQTPSAAMTLNMSSVSLAKVFKQVNTVQKLAPIFENMTGTFGLDFDFKSPLGQDMMPVMDKMTAVGMLSSNDFSVSNVKALDMIASALKNESLKNIKAKDLKINFTIDNGRVTTKPFDIKMGTVNMNLAGSTGLDQTIDYVAKVAVPNKLTANVPLNVGVTIGGTFSSPKIGLDGQSIVSSVTDVAKEKLSAEALKLIEQAEAKKNELVAAAQTNGQKLRDEAAKQADALVAKAQEQATALEGKASNAIAKVAAKKAGEKLVQEAQKQADNLKAKADETATKLETTAQTEGDKLIQAAQEKAQ